MGIGIIHNKYKDLKTNSLNHPRTICFFPDNINENWHESGCYSLYVCFFQKLRPALALGGRGEQLHIEGMQIRR